MKPLYSILRNNHYSSDSYSPDFVSAEDVYKEIGYSLNDLYKQNRAYENTCAVRMSLALIMSSVPFHGRLKIKAGPYKGWMVETGAKLLADQLMSPHIFGRPELLSPMTALNKLQGKKGVVFFWKLRGNTADHIDLIEPVNNTQVCHSNCYVNCKEVWFWPLS